MVALGQPPRASAEIIPLHDYQRDALDAIHAAYGRGITRQLVTIPTGGGKTILAAHAVREIAAPRTWQTVFLVHRDELVRQSVAKLHDINPDLSVGVVQAEQNRVDANVVIASVPTLARPARLDALLRVPAPGRFVIVDEAHHCRAVTYERVLTGLAPDLLLGITATPERGDKKRLGSVFQDRVYDIGMLELMARNRLARLVGIQVGTDTMLDDVPMTGEDFDERALETAVDSPTRNRLIVEAWQRYAAGRKKTLVFCAGITHAEHVAAAFQDAGIDARCVFGHTPREERRATLDAFSHGAFAVLVNVGIATEGYDEPGIDCLIHARPTQSRPLYQQMTGRATRTAKGKVDALILDVVDVSSRHQLISLVDLADQDDDPEPKSARPRDREPIDLLEWVMKREQERHAKLAKVTRAVELFGASRWEWHDVAGVQAARATHDAWIFLEPHGDDWLPCLVSAGQNEPPSRIVLFDRPLALELAMGVAEQRAEAIGRTAAGLVQRGTAWRQTPRPATEAQRRYARRLRVQVADDDTTASLSDKISDAIFTKSLKELARS